MQENRRPRREPAEPPAPQKKRKKKITGWIVVKKLFSILFSTLLSLFLICIITGTIVATAATIYVLDFMDESSTITLEEMELSYNSNVYAYDKEGNLLTLYEVPNEIQRIPVPLEMIPRHTLDAFIYTEDERFYTHDGVDYKNTVGAFMNLVFSFWDTERGGSTITQQLIKNVTGDDDPSPSRKIREIFRAMTLEKNYPKDKIIDTYLNYIGFGGAANGIQMASMKYFGKNVNELTIAESAVLAAIPQSPETINPFAGYRDDETGEWVNTGRQRNRDRMEYVLWQMYDHGAITYDEYQQALAEHIIYTDTDEYKQLHPELEAEKYKDEAATSWVVDAAIREVQAYLMTTYNLDADDALERFNSGGYQVYTTVDMDMQEYVEEKFLDLNNLVKASSVAKYEDTNGDGVIDDQDTVIYPQVSFIAMDYEGRVLSVVGATGKKEDALIWNYATMEPRQPGSTMKPVAGYGYGIYTDQFHWGSMLKDYSLTLSDGTLWPHNYGGSKGSGENKPMYYGLMRSLNTTSARLVDALTPEAVFNFSRDNLGLNLTEIDAYGNTDMALSPLSVGALTYGVTVQNMVNAYIPYGNGGTYYKSHIVSRLEQGNHELVYENNGDPHEAVDPETAYVMNRMMKNVVSSQGTAGAARLANKEVVGKTGTTQNWDDLWFIGLTEDFVSGAWIGYVERDTIEANPSSAQLWYNIIGEYANSLDTDAEYPKCDTVIEAAICTNSGLIASSSCPKGEKGYWKSSNAPKCSGCVVETTEDPSATKASEDEDEEKPSSSTSAPSGGDTPAPTDPPETQAPEPPAPTDPPAPPVEPEQPAEPEQPVPEEPAG
ncbi:MAG: penicillin-binding protein [Oscillospiraceae bacterium]|nr:penicillin-binding protein [Oscillospiraceae bacterium]